MSPRRSISSLALIFAAVLLLPAGCRIVVKPDYMLDKLEYGRPYQTDHFVIYLENDYGDGYKDDLAVWLEEIYEKVGDLLGHHPEERTTVKIYSSPLPATDELEFYGYAGERAIYSKKYPGTRRNLAHEYTHLVAARVAGVPIPAYFNEGLATFVSNHIDGPDSPTFEEEIFDFVHGDFLARHSRLGARSITRLPERASAIRETYAYRSSFISFLVEEYGFEVILATLHRARLAGDVETALEEVVGIPFTELDRKWERFIRAHTNPERYERFAVIRDWLVVGPFDNTDGAGFHRPGVPEAEIDPEAVLFEMNRPIRWRRFRSNHPVGVVNLLHGEFSPSHHVYAYAATWVESPEERDVTIRAGADDTLTVWCNGERVISRSARRTFRTDEEVVTARLRKGRNEILVKVCQFTGEWMFALRITDDDGDPIPGLRVLPIPADGSAEY